MKKSICIIFLLLIFVLTINIYADEEIGDTASDTTGNTEEEIVEEESQIFSYNVKAKVISVSKTDSTQGNDISNTVQNVKIKILEGTHKDEELETTYTISYDNEGKFLTYELSENNIVWVHLTESSDGSTYVSIQSVSRHNYILILLIIFFISLGLILKKACLKPIFIILLSILSIYFILIKPTVLGYNPILMSIICAITISIFSALLINGLNKKVITVILGVFAGATISGLLFLLFSNLTKLSGISDDVLQFNISSIKQDINFSVLMFISNFIASLGICLYLATNIVNRLDTIKSEKSDISFKDLFKNGINLGKEVLISFSNVLILSYIGTNLTLIILLMCSDLTIIQTIDKEVIAEQILISLCSSIGMIYSIPVTSALYGIFNKEKLIYQKKSRNKLEGKRSLKL